uniref:Uncharacterized protein n=1 Tax=Campylobacter lari TaxID=201 RepID=Q53U44_CAMLA|nr:hypothetical protein [Campylobacter lari]
MASLRFSDSLLRTKFAGRITEGIDRNTDEPRNETRSQRDEDKSRLSRAESRESRAESERSEANLSTSKIIYGKNGEKIRGINNL